MKNPGSGAPRGGVTYIIAYWYRYRSSAGDIVSRQAAINQRSVVPVGDNRKSNAVVMTSSRTLFETKTATRSDEEVVIKHSMLT
jgi:hypothetical protein